LKTGGGPLLAVDAGSPRVSVAVGAAEAVLAEASEGRDRSSATLLALVDGVLGAAGLRPRELAGLLALRGPGSFTGLRVGLATVLGLHQALRLPATGLSTLEVLAGLGPGDGSTVVAVVDALRGDWFAQPFRSAAPPSPLDDARLLPAAELTVFGPCTIAGFGATGLAGLEESGSRAIEPPPLAGLAVRHVGRFSTDWDPAGLVAPLYLRPPSARPPLAPRSTRPPAERP
jgi:tRNA threonylcarbamoyladenosine biosynthesis protein TsaB